MIYQRTLTMAVIGVFLLLILSGRTNSVPSSGDIRLVGSSNGTAGRVEIFHSGSWGTVCDNFWDMNEGNVVCRQLGFTGAIAVYSSAYFGNGNGTIWMSNVMCIGNESKLEDCPHRGWGVSYCSHSEDAGVACENATQYGSGGGSCSFEIGQKLCGYTNLKSDDYDWTRKAGYYYSYYLPKHDHTTGNGYFIYVRRTGSYRSIGKKAQIMSPLLEDVKCVHFFYFMKGLHVGQLNLYVKYGSNKTLLWQNVGPQSAVWIKGIVPIKGVTSAFRIIFEGVMGGNYAADIAIDDIEVFKKPCVYNATGNCTFEPGVLCGYSNAADNAIKWVLHKGRVNYYSFGPYRDHTTGNGYFVYLKTTYSTIKGQQSQLISPEIYGRRCVQFYYYIAGSTPGELSIYIDDGVKRILVWQLIGRQGNNWQKGTVPVKQNLKAFKVIFEGISGSYYQGRIALDDILVLNKPCKVFPSEASVKPIDIHSMSKEVRLVGGKTNSSGRVEVFHKGRWGTICGYSFPLTSARVVCRQLGFSDVAMVVPCCSVFGAGKGRILLQNVKCRGKEPDIKMCSHSPWGMTTCSHTNDVGVVCKTNYDDKSVRLNSSSHDYEGRAEVEISGVWGTISSNSWDIFDADVFCRQAGFKGASEVLNNPHNWRMRVWITNTNCNGDEMSFWKCNYTTIARRYWYGRDAGVKCYDLKLVGGNTKNEGIVLIRWEGAWGTICNDGWDMRDAHVTCRNLGYSRAKSIKLGYHVTTSHTNKTASLLSQFECKGDEPSLATCRRRSLALVSHQCTHDNDAMVVCDNTKIRSTPKAPLSPTTKTVPMVCKKSQKYGKVCVCGNTDSAKSVDCYVLGVDINIVSLRVNKSQWNLKRFKNLLAKQLTVFCTNHSCGHNSSSNNHFTSSDVIIIKNDSQVIHGQVGVQFLVFDPHTKKPISSDVIKSMITHDKMLAGFKVSHFGHPVPHTHASHRKSHPNVIMIVGIALAALWFCAVVVFAIVYRKRKSNLRALVRYHAVSRSAPELDLTDEGNEDNAREEDRLLRLNDDDHDQASLLPSSSTVVV